MNERRGSEEVGNNKVCGEGGRGERERERDKRMTAKEIKKKV